MKDLMIKSLEELINKTRKAAKTDWQNMVLEETIKNYLEHLKETESAESILYYYNEIVNWCHYILVEVNDSLWVN